MSARVPTAADTPADAASGVIVVVSSGSSESSGCEEWVKGPVAEKTAFTTGEKTKPAAEKEAEEAG